MPDTDNSGSVPRQELNTVTRASTWRASLPTHSAADFFPLMADTDPAALKALGEDIIKNGLASSIVLWSDGKSPICLLDGRNRLDAVELATGSPAIVGPSSIMAGKDFACNQVIVLDKSVDPYAYVISANIRRRHLSIEDRDRLIVKVLQADPAKSNRAVAKLTDTSHPHVAKVREQAEKAGDVETVTTSIDTKGRKQPAKRGWSRERWARHRAKKSGRRPQTATAIKTIVPTASEDQSRRQDIGPESADEPARRDVCSEEHFKSQAIGLRKEVVELKARVRDLENRAERALSLEQVVDELARRPESRFFSRPWRLSGARSLSRGGTSVQRSRSERTPFTEFRASRAKRSAGWANRSPGTGPTLGTPAPSVLGLRRNIPHGCDHYIWTALHGRQAGGGSPD